LLKLLKIELLTYEKIFIVPTIGLLLQIHNNTRCTLHTYPSIVKILKNKRNYWTSFSKIKFGKEMLIVNHIQYVFHYIKLTFLVHCKTIQTFATKYCWILNNKYWPFWVKVLMGYRFLSFFSICWYWKVG